MQYSHQNEYSKLKPASSGLSVSITQGPSRAAPKPKIKASPSFNLNSHSEPKNRQQSSLQKTPLPIRYQPYSSPRSSPSTKSLEDPLNISGYPSESQENSDDPVFETVTIDAKKVTEEIINQENSEKLASKQKKQQKTSSNEEDPFSETILSSKFEKDIGKKFMP